MNTNCLQGVMCPKCGNTGIIHEFDHPAFYVTFETVTEASAEVGESARSGWWEPGGWLLEGADNKPPEPAYLFDLDDVDDDDHEDLDEAIVEWALALLKREGAMHPNCEPSGDARWWGTEGHEVLDVATGETIRKSFHFHGFSERLWRRVNARMAKED
ncbi:hypothetical protein [Halomonas elongata]|uniref:Uncharacterized protein n=1 Tax=Halomonas elongata (strain ATCC 33173 / DSM 2581 / NBRC 15536 / NCIMB 2198 / 1H9) TaxID=768066 RepID=E1VAM5_HALED|nr:hypothetical protein [Halomonas elongata]WBF17727.1 hypothetical protein LM502_16875 [Halomonas elongata]WPU46569.1 hypothetical protein SR933_15115 [Halomonas elongata DSM 2581]CBV43974.1 uncharacterized protein HELO_4090 [Halomonas elongata DSM 2581]